MSRVVTNVIMRVLEEHGGMCTCPVSYLDHRIQGVDHQIVTLLQRLQLQDDKAMSFGKDSWERCLKTLTEASEIVILKIQVQAFPEGKTDNKDAVEQQQGDGQIDVRDVLIADADAGQEVMTALEETTRATNIPVKGGDEQGTERTLHKGVDVNSSDSYGPALTQAIRSRNESLAICLLERGADPNSRDSYGAALTQAIRGQYKKLAQKMLEHGANPNAKDSYGPAFTQAIRSGDEGLSILLLAQGADPDSRDSFGAALTQAIRGGYMNLVGKLLGSGLE